MAINTSRYKKIKGVVFDLDGTLLNTLPDIALAANKALEKFGYPVHLESTIKKFLGNGSRVLITKAMPEDKQIHEFIEPVLEYYLKKYKNLEQEKTKPYDGILNLLEELKKRNIKTAIVTNKNDFLAEKCVSKFIPQSCFNSVIGQNDNYPAKPHRYMADKAVSDINEKNEDCVFVGDSYVDIKTGLNAGIRTIGVTWGFGQKKELVDSGAWKIIDHPMDLIKIL
jgi:phosphoglycolate phosphatase